VSGRKKTGKRKPSDVDLPPRFGKLETEEQEAARLAHDAKAIADMAERIYERLRNMASCSDGLLHMSQRGPILAAIRETLEGK
jgi:hypothetical protein